MSGNGEVPAAAPPPPSAPPPDRPAPGFEVFSVSPVERAAAPTLRFGVRVRDPSEREIYVAALRTVIELEPSMRRYEPETRERLNELFGPVGTPGAQTRNLRWASVDALVQGFTGEGTFEVTVPCTYDLELASTKYFHGLDDGEVPMRFHFNGQVFYRDPDDRLQIVAVPWECSARYSFPVEVWKQMMDAHYPNGTWLALGAQTLERLRRRRIGKALPSFDATLDDLLDLAGED